MYEVLVPVDRSVDRALHQARYVARLAENGSEVEATVLYVTPSERRGETLDEGFSGIDAAVEAATHLEDAGVAVERFHYDDVMHGFLTMSGAIDRAADAHADLVAALDRLVD